MWCVLLFLNIKTYLQTNVTSWPASFLTFLENERRKQTGTHESFVPTHAKKTQKLLAYFPVSQQPAHVLLHPAVAAGRCCMRNQRISLPKDTAERLKYVRSQKHPHHNFFLQHYSSHYNKAMIICLTFLW